MNNIFENIKFKYKFREYQKRVLSEIYKYIDDEKINIIAAPGAGKTILALQIMIMLKKPTLILAPTIALREQWVDRLKNDFAYNINLDEYISSDIFNPNVITVTTYQALYSVYNQKTEKTKNIDIIQILNDVGVKTIILDEAHHLKKSWLNATKLVIEGTKNSKTISLTATPPYDCDKKLWNNYIELCGEADVEVTVGELVKRKDLATHQDYIFFNNINENEIKQFSEYKKEVNYFIKNLINNEEFILSLATSDIIINSDKRIQYITDNFEYYLAILKLLKTKKIDVPKTPWNEIKNCYITINDIEIILKYTLFKDEKSYKDFKTLYKNIKQDLDKIGAIDDNNEVNLKYTKEISNLITQNIGKLDSICKILSNEKQVMDNNLKAVIITDNIEKDALNLDKSDIKKMGVIPIFKTLIEQTQFTPIVLTGEIIIIPFQIKELLFKICAEEKVKSDNIEFKELASNFNYASFKLLSSDEKSKVNIITKLFEKSEIDVLIGTNALIGEGWDAPFINTLIMASSISAYVTSNQIRGRVIRTYKGNKNKCANIWHLASVEKCSSGKFELGKDFELLTKRFEAFEGIDTEKNKINYSIDRLNIDERIYNDDEINLLNGKMLKNALNRQLTIDKWNSSLKEYVPIRKNDIKKINLSNFANNIYDKDLLTIYKENIIKIKSQVIDKILILNVFFIMSLIMYEIPFFNIITFIIATILIALYLNIMVNSSKFLSLMGKDNNKDYKRICKNLLKTLKQISVINKCAKLVYDKKEKECYLKRANLKENNLFREVFKEFLSNIDNPRYLITNGKVLYQVPNIIGKNKESVKKLYYNIFRNTKAGIIYTVTENGKKILLKIKTKQIDIDNGINLKQRNISLDVINEDGEVNKKIIEDVNLDINIMKDVLKAKKLNKEEK